MRPISGTGNAIGLTRQGDESVVRKHRKEGKYKFENPFKIRANGSDTG
jgi:hypothetical protein